MFDVFNETVGRWSHQLVLPPPFYELWLLGTGCIYTMQIYLVWICWCMYIYMPYVSYIYYLDSRRLIAKRQTHMLLLQLMCKQAPKTWKHIAATVILLVRLWFMNKNSGELDIIPKKNWKLMRQKCSKPMFATNSWQLLAPSVIACAATKASHTAVAPPLVCLSRYGGPGGKQPRFQGLHRGRLRAPHVIMWWIHGVLQLIIFQLRKHQQRDINFLRIIIV